MERDENVPKQVSNAMQRRRKYVWIWIKRKIFYKIRSHKVVCVNIVPPTIDIFLDIIMIRLFFSSL